MPSTTISASAAATSPPSSRTPHERADRGSPPKDALTRAVEAVERRSIWALALLLALSGALLMYMGRGLTFYYDEWEWILHDYGGGIHWMLLAHVGNISFFPAGIYKVMFHLVGLDHYAAFRLNVVVLHLICGALIYVMAARRIPRLPALLGATLILFLGAAWEDLLWAFQVGYLLSVAGGLATLALLDSKRSQVLDLLAMLCLLVAAGSSSLGIPIMVGVAVELVHGRGQRRLWIVLIPAAFYSLWYLTYGVSQVTEESVIHAPRFAAELAAAAFGGLVGQGLDVGQPLAVAGLAIVLYCLARRPPVSPRLAGLLTAALALWVVIAVARSTISIPEESRYIYLGAVLIVLIGVELLRGVAIAPRTSALAALVVGACTLAGLPLLQMGSSHLRGISSTVTAELGALEIAAAYAPPEYRPDPMYAPPVYAGLYLHTVRSIGSSPADTPADIEGAESSARAAADAILSRLEPPKLQPLGNTFGNPPGTAGRSAIAPAPSLVTLSQATQLRGANCVRLTPFPHRPMSVTLNLPLTGLAIHDEGGYAVALAGRRFGEGFNPLPRGVPARSTDLLSPLPDRAPRIPWQIRLGSRASVSLCDPSA
jgi:hypothetical protein